MCYPTLSAHEAVRRVKLQQGSLVGASGFTQVGVPKETSRALAKIITELGIKVRLISGASAGAFHDSLATVGGVAWVAPFMNDIPLRQGINSGGIGFVDMHLSQVGALLQSGKLGRLDLAIIEATRVEGEKVFLTTSSGISPLLLELAEQVIIEVNDSVPDEVSAMHDVVLRSRPASPIVLAGPLARIGTPYALVDRKKVIGIVRSSEPDPIARPDPPNDRSKRIAEHIVAFLLQERRAGRLPVDNWVFQAGVGVNADAVMGEIAANPSIAPFYMYTETFQNMSVPALLSGRLKGVSTTALMLSQDMLRAVCGMPSGLVVLRPQWVSNAAEVIASLGVIAINTAVEADLLGNVNSTHALTNVINGIGGSADFGRNACVSIFIVPSTAKDGAISPIVPFCAHVDQTEHDTMVLVSEHGLVDTRGLTPVERAYAIAAISHPQYRPYLKDYLRGCKAGHVPVDYGRCHELHRAFDDEGSMLRFASTGELAHT